MHTKNIEQGLVLYKERERERETVKRKRDSKRGGAGVMGVR